MQKTITMALIGVVIVSVMFVYVVSIGTDDKSTPFYAKYKKTVFIEYPEDGLIHDQISRQHWQVAGSADSSDPGVQGMMDQMNQDLLDSESLASVSDLKVSYKIQLMQSGYFTSGYYPRMIDSTIIDYTIILEGRTSNDLVTIDSQRELFDRGWRGFSVHDGIVVDGMEINMPIGILESRLPDTHELLAGTKADTVLLQPIIDADFIVEQSIADWHFHRERTVPGPDPFPGLGYIPISFSYYWTLGELEPITGYGSVKIYAARVTLDREYIISSTQPEIWGLEARSVLNGVIAALTMILTVLVMLHDLNLSVYIMGIPVLAAMAGIGLFLVRRRDCKRQPAKHP